MRKLIVTRGHQGSGKSHALKHVGMEDWTLSTDMLRTVLAGPFMVEDGRVILNQQVNQRVFPLFEKLADERMARGETLALDSTLTERRDLARWMELAKKHRYQVALLDMSTVSLDLALGRNSNRPATRRVPDWKITEVHELLNQVSARDVGPITVIQGRDDNSHLQEMQNWLREPVRDLSSYSKVVHIGDLQGCHSVLAGRGGPLENGFRDDEFYILIGDLLDRGIENAEVFQWFMQEALHRDNVVLLWGNHEDHLHLWATGQEAVSNEFLLRTLPQLEAAGFTAADADAICNKAQDFLQYTYRGKEVLATHAGLSACPAEPHLISLEQYSKGTGHWSDPVDEQFERNTSEVFQVHGHRNHGHVGIHATPRSFNLEDAVEFGGHLRTCSLDANGWSTAAYRNPVFRTMRERLGLETVMSAARKHERKIVPHWVLDGESKGSTAFDPETLAAMRAHTGVREKSSERYPHVNSLNFTKRVFFERSWDDVVVKARGLFFNSDTTNIVARGYDKFFNIGERPETELANLLEKLVFPARGYVKENGFLGNIGYDEQTDTLFEASKSTPDGDFADMFLNILDESLSAQQREAIRRYLRDTESSMTFEVIDPVGDPHMIEYGERKIVLLDIIRRSTEFEKASFEVLEAAGRKLGLETKKLGLVFKNATQFAGWYKKVTNEVDYRVNGQFIEGLVIEDAAGFMTKVKFPYYAFWKQMRTMKDRLISSNEKGTDFHYNHVLRADRKQPASEEEVRMAENFRDWCLQQDNETLKSDIITLRNAFGQDFGKELTSSATLTP